MKKILIFVVALVIPQLAGFIGALFTSPNINSWYNNLLKPELAPENWVFMPVWTILFLMMGIALGLVWTKTAEGGLKKRALIFFTIQLVLNTLWSIIFFGFQNPGLAFVEIIFLLIFILATAISFWKVNRWASILLWPYFAWVSFASYLNYQLWFLNF